MYRIFTLIIALILSTYITANPYKAIGCIETILPNGDIQYKKEPDTVFGGYNRAKKLYYVELKEVDPRVKTRHYENGEIEITSGRAGFHIKSRYRSTMLDALTEKINHHLKTIENADTELKKYRFDSRSVRKAERALEADIEISPLITSATEFSKKLLEDPFINEDVLLKINQLKQTVYLINEKAYFLKEALEIELQREQERQRERERERQREKERERQREKERERQRERKAETTLLPYQQTATSFSVRSSQETADAMELIESISQYYDNLVASVKNYENPFSTRTTLTRKNAENLLDAEVTGEIKLKLEQVKKLYERFYAEKSYSDHISRDIFEKLNNIYSSKTREIKGLQLRLEDLLAPTRTALAAPSLAAAVPPALQAAKPIHRQAVTTEADPSLREDDEEPIAIPRKRRPGAQTPSEVMPPPTFPAPRSRASLPPFSESLSAYGRERPQALPAPSLSGGSASEVLGFQQPKSTESADLRKRLAKVTTYTQQVASTASNYAAQVVSNAVAFAASIAPIEDLTAEEKTAPSLEKKAPRNKRYGMKRVVTDSDDEEGSAPAAPRTQKTSGGGGGGSSTTATGAPLAREAELDSEVPSKENLWAPPKARASKKHRRTTVPDPTIDSFPTFTYGEVRHTARRVSGATAAVTDAFTDPDGVTLNYRSTRSGRLEAKGGVDPRHGPFTIEYREEAGVKVARYVYFERKNFYIDQTEDRIVGGNLDRGVFIRTHHEEPEEEGFFTDIYPASEGNVQEEITYDASERIVRGIDPILGEYRVKSTYSDRTIYEFPARKLTLSSYNESDNYYGGTVVRGWVQGDEAATKISRFRIIKFEDDKKRIYFRYTDGSFDVFNLNYQFERTIEADSEEAKERR